VSAPLATHGARLDALAREYAVPGASLAIWKDGELFEHATGVINRRTGVEATPDAIFQIGSITKLMTAVLVMQLVEDGAIALEDRIVDHLPSFAVADPDTTANVTIADLLTHTSGIDGDFFENTGTGDDKVERFVLACRALPTLHPRGELFSYCNVGFSLLGRILEVKRGATWESVIKRRLIDRLGETSFARYAEETLRYRAAIGHAPPSPGASPDVVPFAYLAKSAAPAGSVLYAAARDLVAFGRMVLREGLSPTGAAVVQKSTLATMLTPRVELPVHSMCRAFGLAFMLFDWNGKRIVGHDGATIGQQAFMRIVPDANAVVVLLTNGGFATELYYRLFPEIFAEAFDIRMPSRPVPTVLPLDAQQWIGTYRKYSQQIVVERDGNELIASVEGLRYGIPRQRFVLEPVTDRLCIGTTSATPTPATFHRLEDKSGGKYLLFGSRVHRKV
jgi:CubicO group peptidase (beta-lactamase class C family)